MDTEDISKKLGEKIRTQAQKIVEIETRHNTLSTKMNSILTYISAKYYNNASLDNIQDIIHQLVEENRILKHSEEPPKVVQPRPSKPANSESETSLASLDSLAAANKRLLEYKLSSDSRILEYTEEINKLHTQTMDMNKKVQEYRHAMDTIASSTSLDTTYTYMNTIIQSSLDIIIHLSSCMNE